MDEMENKDFTLVEIIIITWMIALLAAISIHNFLFMRNETSTQNSLKSLNHCLSKVDWSKIYPQRYEK
jgi:Tfp pilus assembly protein FimT